MQGNTLFFRIIVVSVRLELMFLRADQFLGYLFIILIYWNQLPVAFGLILVEA